jgi:peptidyl-prolyl cis-trans isomerase SurA
LRDDAYIEIKPGLVDTGASPNKRVFPIAYAAYTPPAPKKKKKVERTRFRETEHGFRQKVKPAVLTNDQPAAAPAPDKKKKASNKTEASMKPGKKEKIRFGKAPQETLPDKPEAKTEDAGAVPEQTASAAQEPVNPLESNEQPTKKTRFSARAKEPKQPKAKAVVQQQKDAMTPAAPDSAEVADRQTQSAALGLGGNTTTKKKKQTTATTGEKTRLSDRKKTVDTTPPPAATPAPPVAGAPAPAQDTPQPQPQPAAPPQ